VIEKRSRIRRAIHDPRISLDLFCLQVVPNGECLSKLWKLEATDPETASNNWHATLGNFLLSVAKLDSSLLDEHQLICESLVDGLMEKDGPIHSTVLQAISLINPAYFKAGSVSKLNN